MEQQIFGLPKVDPFSTLDKEIAGLNAFFAALGPAEWQAPTRCEGWTIRNMLAHFDSDEEYNEACLAESLESLFSAFTDLDDFNNRQIQKRQHFSNKKLLKQWRSRQTGVRKTWKELGLSAEIATSIGPYALHAQIWHITSEYATHADDMGVKVPPEAQHARLQWRFQFSAFAVQEKNNPPGLERRDNRMIITLKTRCLSLSLADFVAAVSARLALPQNPADRKLVEALRSLA